MEQNTVVAIDELSPAELFGELTLTRVRFLAATSPQADLSRFSGSAWRGLLGHQLQNLVCPFPKRPPCGECVIAKSCSYSLLFEEESTAQGLSEAPRGYVFHPEPPAPDGRQAVNVTLFGQCAKFLPAVAKAAVKGQRAGLGAKRVPYVLTGMEQLFPDGATLSLSVGGEVCSEAQGPQSLKQWLEYAPSPGTDLEILATTPLRLRKGGKYLEEMDRPFLLQSLARRLESLHCLFGEGQPLGKERWLGLKQNLEQDGNLRGTFHWWDYKRYSGRQKRQIPMGGIVGKATLRNPSPTEIEWWKAAELVHVGKGAAMGLGKLELCEATGA